MNVFKSSLQEMNEVRTDKLENQFLPVLQQCDELGHWAFLDLYARFLIDSYGDEKKMITSKRRILYLNSIPPSQNDLLVGLYFLSQIDLPIAM